MLAPSFEGSDAQAFSDPRTLCLIHPENRASLRVAEKCGFRDWFRASYKAEPALLLLRTPL